MRSPHSLAHAWPAPVRGALWMCTSSFIFTGMLVLLKMASAELHPFVMAFLRNFFGLLFILPFIGNFRFVLMGSRNIGLHLWRAGIGLVSMLCWFTAVSVLPIAVAQSLSFTSPMFSTVGAAIVLHERVHLRRWSATFAGLLGVLVILRPGVEAVDPAALLALISAALGACTSLIIKRLTGLDASTTIVAYMVLFLTPMSLVPALFVWQWPSWPALTLMIGVGAVGTLGHLCFTRALKEADASYVIPFDYVRMPLVALLGVVVFDEVVDAWTLLGAAIILGSALYIGYREGKLARLGRSAQPAAIAGVVKDKL